MNTLDDTRCQYELLNFGPRNAGYKMSARLGIDSARIHTVREQLRFVKMAREYSCRDTKQCHFGFKLFPGHTANLSAFLGADVTCVVNRRSNVTAQYLSLQRALHTGCWDTTPTKRCRPFVPFVDPREVSSLIRRHSHWYAHVEAACAGYRTLRLNMEDWVKLLSTT